jgi:hypothetical protein
MSSDKKVHDYAGGWITSRTDTDAPAFLKFVLPIVAIAGVVYTVIFMNGEIGHSTRGTLVKQMNAATGTADIFMYMVAAFIAIFFIFLTKFLFSKDVEE